LWLLALLNLALLGYLAWERFGGAATDPAPAGLLPHSTSSDPLPGSSVPAPARPLPDDLLASERHVISLFERAAPSVAYITTHSRQAMYFPGTAPHGGDGAGSGFVWDRDGHIVTNFHVIAEASEATVTLADGSEWPARLVGASPDQDLAVLRIKAPAERLAPLPVGSSKGLRVGQFAMAIGNPFGLDQTLTTGVVSALDREMESISGRTIYGVVQTDAAINPGNSGGPLIDTKNRVIGINTAIASTSGGSNGVGFAVPVTDAQDLMNEVKDNGGAQAPSIPAPQGSTGLPDLGFDFTIPDSLGDLFGDLFDELLPGQEGPNQGQGQPAPKTAPADTSIVTIDPLPDGWSKFNDMSFLSNGEGVQNIVLVGPDGQITVTATKGSTAADAAKQYSGAGEVRRFDPDLTVVVEGLGNVADKDLKAVADAIKPAE
jgi:S1-C subfamily serine protease